MICNNCDNLIAGELVSRFPYKQCGLPNVFLVNLVTKYECSCVKKYFEFPSIEITYLVIAYQLLKKKTLLTKEEFRFLRKWIGFTDDKLIRHLGVKSRVTVSNWETGKKPITEATDHAMRMLVLMLKNVEIRQVMMAEIKLNEWLTSIKPVIKKENINVNQEKIAKFSGAPRPVPIHAIGAA